MKKKILASIFVFVLTLTALTATVFAERKRELPVNMERQMYSKVYKMTLESFEVTDVEHIPEKKINKIRYKLNYTEQTNNAALWLQMKCFDKNSVHIDTVDIYSLKSSYAEVPENTAKIEIVLEDATYRSDSYYYSRYMEVYSADGRTKTISELLLPVYEKVGWTAGVKMYALDGRTKEVAPYKVKDYEKVGWYTKDGYEYQKIKNTCDGYNAVGDYNSTINLVNKKIVEFSDKNYQQKLADICRQARESWRKAIDTPMAVLGYSLSENSIGTPEVTINFRNISEKNIIAYKVKFDCYNVFGELEESYYDGYYDDDANMLIAYTDKTTWTLYGADSVHTVKNIRVTEVVFKDGTKWKR